MVTSRTIREELVKDQEEYQEAALRRYDPEMAFLMTVINLHHTENSKFKKAFAPADLVVFYSLISGIFPVS